LQKPEYRCKVSIEFSHRNSNLNCMQKIVAAFSTIVSFFS